MENIINPNLFQTPYNEFKEHLNIEDNRRILFSGRFGIGKTTFVKWFFEKPEIKEKYEVLHIYPVNYSVASNEDIFKYIKLDIIRQLLEKEEVTIEHIDISKFEYLPYFMDKNLRQVFAAILTSGVSAYAELKGDKGFTKNVLSKLEALYEKFKADFETTKVDISETQGLFNFIEPVINQEGNIYEFNVISQLIVQLLNSWKEKIGNKQILLIIDDLDRVDPNHIFRIFNVFAAHFDHPTSSEQHNKFGFDKIVSVADINNIKSIFNSKFGMDTDFSGYLDKFFSHSVFAFNNIAEIHENVTAFLKKFSYKIDDSNRIFPLSDVIKYDYISKDLSFLISAFLLSGKINFRRLTPKEILLPANYSKREFYILNTKCYVVAKIQCLVAIVGSIDKLIESLIVADKIIGKSIVLNSYDYTFNEGLPLLNFDLHSFNYSADREFIAYVDDFTFTYKITNDNVANIIQAFQKGNSLALPLPIQPSRLPSIFKLYIECIMKLRQIGYLDF